MTAEPDPAAIMANLEVLESKLSGAFGAKADYAKAMQDRYVVALTAVANFLVKAGIEEEIAHKFAELASAISEGSVPFLQPPKASGRTFDSQAIWMNRAYAVVGLECILRSKKMNKQDAARYIAKKYPVFNRLKRNPSASLANSILSWRRYYDEGRGYEHIREEMAKHYQLRPPDKMFEHGEVVLQKAAKLVAQAVL
jgi:hypothetical protein